MQKITRESVAEHIQLRILEEKPHPTMPAITVGGLGGPHLEFVELVTKVLHETGDVLQGAGYPNLGSFILEAIKEAERVGKAAGGGANPDVIVQRLAQAFPSFRDMDSFEDKRQYFLPRQSSEPCPT